MSSADFAIIVFFGVAAAVVSAWFLVPLGAVAALFFWIEYDEVSHPWEWRRR